MIGKGWLSIAACTGLLCASAPVFAQSPASPPDSGAPAHVCACGAHPPAPPRDREVEPYAGEPEDMAPWARYAKPYYLYYTHPTLYTGAARDIPDPKNITEVRIGFIAPLEGSSDAVFGQRMLHGAELAVEEANARGGYGGKPFRLMLHNDYNNWQENAVSGSYRPTDPGIWGSSSDVGVKMIYDEHDWAIFGSINSETTHILLRLVLKAETPIVNSASTDPTIPETSIPWYFTDLQDDRVQAYTLARRIYTELGLKRVAILRVNNRYGRMGVPKFREASVRLGHPVVIEQKYLPGDTDFTRELRIIRDSRVQAVVLWADEAEAAAILKQMRALGMKQRVFGSYRTLGPQLLAEAGPAAEGFQAVFPYNPTRKDPRWIAFNQRFEARFHEPPDQFASLAYDAMNILLDAICNAGLNRARIQDALDDIGHYDGVTGRMIFDPNQKNVAPMFLGTVHNGAIAYRPAGMSKPPAQAQAPTPHPATETAQPRPLAHSVPYARIDANDVGYFGPHRPNLPSGPVVVVLFGPNAETIAHSPAMRAALAEAPGRAWKLVPVGSDVRWSKADWPVWAASSQLVQAMTGRNALAVIALNTDAAHLAEQLSLKCFVPVVALANDRSLTSANIPWIFRLPAATTPAAALRILEQAAARQDPNPERIRDLLASGSNIAGTAFLPSGEPRRP